MSRSGTSLRQSGSNRCFTSRWSRFSGREAVRYYVSLTGKLTHGLHQGGDHDLFTLLGSHGRRPLPRLRRLIWTDVDGQLALCELRSCPRLRDRAESPAPTGEGLGTPKW